MRGWAKTAELVSRTKVILVAVVAVAMGAGYYGAHALASKPSSIATDNTACNGTCVYINSNGFSQDEMAVKVGESIEFRTADGQTHNLALGNGMEVHESAEVHDNSEGRHDEEGAEATGSHDHIGGTESGVFGADEAWRVQFKKPGTFVVHDHLRPDSSILIVVYESK